MYTTLLEKVRIELEEQQNKTIKRFESNKDVLKRYSTPTRWTQYQSGQLTHEQAIDYATKRLQNSVEKEYKTKAWQLAKAESETTPGQIVVVVEWVKSATWGRNPKATARTNRHEGVGRASGCGYDKHSAAVAEALNECPDIQKLLFDYMEAQPLDASNRATLGYGSGYGALPYFEGGCGLSYIVAILAKLGYAYQFAGTGNTDVHVFTRRG